MALSIDLDVFSEYSRFVDWEGRPQWFPVPLTPDAVRGLGITGRWAEVLSLDLTSAECVSRLWADINFLVPRTAKALAARIAGLAVLRTPLFGNSMIYLLGDGDDIDLRRGFAPTEVLPEFSAEFSIDLSAFYRVHNGFVNYMSYDGGLLPTSKWRTIVDPDSGKPSLIEIAVDGSEGFGFDVSERPVRGYVLRPSEDEVRLIPDEWNYFDDLMARQIESP